MLLPAATARLTFRPMSHDDIDDVAELVASPEVMRFAWRTKSRDEAHDWIEWNLRGYADDGFGLWLVHDEQGDFVGQCGLGWQVVDGQRDLEVGYHLMPAHHGRGLATEAAQACRHLARDRGVERLIAIIHHQNLASCRVAEKIGLALEKQITSAFGEPTLIYAGHP